MILKVIWSTLKKAYSKLNKTSKMGETFRISSATTSFIWKMNRHALKLITKYQACDRHKKNSWLCF